MVTVLYWILFPPNKINSQHLLFTKSDAKVGVSIICVELVRVMPPVIAVFLGLDVKPRFV